jgi:hypothetical protein
MGAFTIFLSVHPTSRFCAQRRNGFFQRGNLIYFMEYVNRIVLNLTASDARTHSAIEISPILTG